MKTVTASKMSGWIRDDDPPVRRSRTNFGTYVLASRENSTRVGPRGVNWRPDKEATLYWTECQDEGDPRNAVGEGNPRDISYLVDFKANRIDRCAKSVL